MFKLTDFNFLRIFPSNKLYVFYILSKHCCYIATSHINFLTVFFLIEFPANSQFYLSKLFLLYIPNSNALSFIKPFLSLSKNIYCPSFELWSTMNVTIKECVVQLTDSLGCMYM